MSDCCASNERDKPASLKLNCPECGSGSLSVTLKTILHHIKRPWSHKQTDEQYYFCRTADCRVVYFSQTGIILEKSEIRTKIAIKENTDNALICFCFGVTNAEASSCPEIKEFVIQQTKNALCSCETSNPSGQCCLKDFPKS